MKNNNVTSLFADKIKSALYARFDCKSCDPKYNAQSNLAGKTHWAEDSNLSFFKARISYSWEFCDGLLFAVDNSVSRERTGDKGHIRTTVFDLFGTVVWEADRTNRKACDKALKEWSKVFDARAHYKQACKEQAKRMRDEASRISAAIR